MRLEKNVAAAQCAALWAQKFALLVTFLVLQEEESGIELIIVQS
jgi:hypothetical protein